MSSFWFVPLVLGLFIFKALFLNSNTLSLSNNCSSFSSSIISTVLSSWLVLNPSKKCIKGREHLIAERCATAARSCASWTLEEEIIHQPVCLHAYTSEWSPNIDSACVATVLLATCITAGRPSPAILYIFGIINSNPWLAVKVVAKLPAKSAPCIHPAAPASDCISTTFTVLPNKFFSPLERIASTFAAIGLEGVIG